MQTLRCTWLASNAYLSMAKAYTDGGLQQMLIGRNVTLKS